MSAGVDRVGAPVRRHGTRALYGRGCRCFRCRLANADYQTARTRARSEGETVFVSSERSRRHLGSLKRKGVGLRAVSARTDLGRTTLKAIRDGSRSKVLVRTEALILSVQPRHAAPRALVSAMPTWRRIGRLLEAGWTKSAIARAIGQESKGLQLGRVRVTKANADRVRDLHDRARGGGSA